MLQLKELTKSFRQPDGSALPVLDIRDFRVAEGEQMVLVGHSGCGKTTLLRIIAPILFRFTKANRFVPDLFVEDGFSLSEYGFDAQVLSIPGHSKGSIGILTASGDLLCGDLLENDKEPALNSIMDDRAAAKASVEKLKGLEIKAVYPGHGKPFPMDRFTAGD